MRKTFQKIYVTGLLIACASLYGATPPERVSTAVPFPRGLAVVDEDLYVLARGRVRGAGGVSAEINDRAGTLYRMDLTVAEPLDAQEVSAAVRANGEIYALPTSPPFKLWNRNANPPESDRWTDRPYCTLRYHALTHSFYICAFSGVDKAKIPGDPSFSKNLTDAVLRYDTRTERWYEVERHKQEAGGSYPHHDPRYKAPPHGWVNGPDNCLPLGSWLYVVGKDNDVLVQYDLSELMEDPNASSPPSKLILDKRLKLKGGAMRECYGHSTLAYRDGFLYIGTRTSSIIFRIPLDKTYAPIEPIEAEIVAYFDPYDPIAQTSADITDMGFDDQGRLYVVSAQPSRVYRFAPDPQHIFDAREGKEAPWADMAVWTNNPKMKSENVLYHKDYLYITSGDGYGYQEGADGAVYRIPVID